MRVTIRLVMGVSVCALMLVSATCHGIGTTRIKPPRYLDYVLDGHRLSLSMPAFHYYDSALGYQLGSGNNVKQAFGKDRSNSGYVVNLWLEPITDGMTGDARPGSVRPLRTGRGLSIGDTQPQVRHILGLPAKIWITTPHGVITMEPRPQGGWRKTGFGPSNKRGVNEVTYLYEAPVIMPAPNTETGSGVRIRMVYGAIYTFRRNRLCAVGFNLSLSN